MYETLSTEMREQQWGLLLITTEQIFDFKTPLTGVGHLMQYVNNT